MSEMADRDRARIRLENVSKRYARQRVDAMLIRELATLRSGDSEEPDEVWALSDVSFDVDEGESVAVLGENGSGKSTLLSLVAGAGRPTGGCVSVRGRVTPVLALGVGFELDMTSVENAYLTASLLGVPAETVADVLDEILDFSELRHVADVPVRHHSSGMLARLGFAVAMHVPHDILLIDEVLAVGDQGFQNKCVERVRELQAGGQTMLFATHDLPMAERLCDRGIWIRDGRIALDAAIDECVKKYGEFLGG